MKNHLSTVLMAAVLLMIAAPAQPAEKKTEAERTEIFNQAEGSKDWASYLADTAAGSVSAATLLGISGESVAPVENLRDLVASLKGLSSDDSNTTLAVSVTPGRTELAPVSHAWYKISPVARLLSATTFSYAQGDADIEGNGYERRAVSIETSLIIFEDDDPVLVLGKALANEISEKNEQFKNCYVDKDPAVRKVREEEMAKEEIDKKKHDADKALADAKDAAKKESGNTLKMPAVEAARKEAAGEESRESVVLKLGEDPTSKAEQASIRECFAANLKNIRWNRSRIALMCGTGWIKPKSGGEQESLGRTAAVSLSYGFEMIPWLQDHFGASVIYRLSLSEPVLNTLGSGTVNEKDNSLVVGRLSGGSNRIRALVEVSNTKADGITPSQRAFKRAVGLDVRVYEGTWINLRIGRQRSVDGTDTEIGSLLSLSYSPSSLLK